jgi:hypothetical protein
MVYLLLSECKVCTPNERSALTGFVSIPKLRRDSMKLSLCKECKATAARRVESPVRTKSCVRICYKECIDLEAQEKELQQSLDRLQGEIWAIILESRQKERTQGENRSRSSDLDTKDQQSLDPSKVHIS